MVGLRRYPDRCGSRFDRLLHLSLAGYSSGHPLWAEAAPRVRTGINQIPAGAVNLQNNLAGAARRGIQDDARSRTAASVISIQRPGKTPKNRTKKAETVSPRVSWVDPVAVGVGPGSAVSRM